MIRAVLDTNVVVSALIWGGTQFRLFTAARRHEIQLATSSALVSELAVVLKRPHLAGRLRGMGQSVETALAAYGQLVTNVTPPIRRALFQAMPMTITSLLRRLQHGRRSLSPATIICLKLAPMKRYAF